MIRHFLHNRSIYLSPVQTVWFSTLHTRLIYPPFKSPLSISLSLHPGMFIVYVCVPSDLSFSDPVMVPPQRWDFSKKVFKTTPLAEPIPTPLPHSFMRRRRGRREVLRTETAGIRCEKKGKEQKSVEKQGGRFGPNQLEWLSKLNIDYILHIDLVIRGANNACQLLQHCYSG